MHNNYFTLPVLFTMIAGHFAFTYGADRAWLVLLVLMFARRLRAALLQPAPPGHARSGRSRRVGVVVLVLLAIAIRPDDERPATGAATVAFAEVAPVIAQRCAPCHAQAPTQPGFSSPPAGVVLETPAQIAARAEDIKRVVSSKAMPLGNVTGMTSEERALVVAWVTQGASTER